MKKFFAWMLAVVMLLSVPAVLYAAEAHYLVCNNDNVDSGITFSSYCSNCDQITSCEDCSIPAATQYTCIDENYHVVSTYYETVCTQCNSRWGTTLWYEIQENHTFNQNDECEACGY